MRKNSLPLVSVIIPVFNGEKYIGDTLNSIFSQNYSNLEIIIIDDGSNDHTKQVIHQHDCKHLFYFYQKNSGVSKSRNVGLKMSKGEFVLFFDADDLTSERYITNRVTFLQQTGLDFCGGDVIPYCDSSGNVKPHRTSVTKNIFHSILTFDQTLMTCPSSYLIKRDCLTKNNIKFNETLSNSADKYFLLEISRMFNYGHITDAPLYYRQHLGSMSGNIKLSNIKDGKRYLNAVLKNIHLNISVRNEFISYKYYNISAEYYALSVLNIPKSILYLIKTLYYSPNVFYKLFLKNNP